MTRTRAAILCVAVVYLVTLATLEKRGFWITDNANKFLQLQALVAQDFKDASLPWAGRSVDPELAYNPIPPPFSFVRAGEIHSQYSPVFAALSSIPYRWGGMAGLYLLPLLGGLAALAAVARIAARLAPEEPRAPAFAVLVAGLATPVWFYSVVFWEHTPALALALWSLERVLAFAAGGSSGSRVAAAILAASAVYFRDDLLLFSSMLAVLTVAVRRQQRATTVLVWIATTLLVLAPLAAVHWIASGDPLGFHLRSNAADPLAHLIGRGAVFRRLFLATATQPLASILVALPCLALLVFRPGRSLRWLPVAGGLALIVSAVHGVDLALTPLPISWVVETNSLFPAAPVLLLGLVGLPWGLPRQVALLALAHAAGYAILAPQAASVGIHWGNRFLLVLYPLLACLAGVQLARFVRWNRGPGSGDRERRGPSRLGGAVLGLALAASCLTQLYSIRLLDRKTTFSYRANVAAGKLGDGPIVADTWWIGQELFSQFYDRPMFFVSTPQDLQALSARLAGAGHVEMLFVTRDDGSLEGRGAVIVDDGGLGSFSLAMLRIPLANDTRPPTTADDPRGAGRTPS